MAAARELQASRPGGPTPGSPGSPGASAPARPWRGGAGPARPVRLPAALAPPASASRRDGGPSGGRGPGARGPASGVRVRVPGRVPAGAPRPRLGTSRPTASARGRKGSAAAFAFLVPGRLTPRGGREAGTAPLPGRGRSAAGPARTGAPSAEREPRFSDKLRAGSGARRAAGGAGQGAASPPGAAARGHSGVSAQSPRDPRGRRLAVSPAQ